jgi:hypothetical protein
MSSYGDIEKLKANFIETSEAYNYYSEEEPIF